MTSRRNEIMADMQLIVDYGIKDVLDINGWVTEEEYSDALQSKLPLVAEHLGNINKASLKLYEDTLTAGVYLYALGLADVGDMLLSSASRIEKVFVTNGVPLTKIHELKGNSELRVSELIGEDVGLY